jgi:hypothetical protein
MQFKLLKAKKPHCENGTQYKRAPLLQLVLSVPLDPYSEGVVGRVLDDQRRSNSGHPP